MARTQGRANGVAAPGIQKMKLQKLNFIKML